MRWFGGLGMLGLLAGACAAQAPAPIALRFTADPGPPGSERYLCFGFDAALLDGADLGGLILDPPRGPVSLHHVALYASTGHAPDGPVECETMPEDAISLHVWPAGSGDLDLDPELAIAIPAGTQRLIVQAHALRLEDGAAAARTVLLIPRRDATHRAGWMPLRGPIPAIAPHQRVTSQASCLIAETLHVISTWPHMHLVGAEFHGTIVRPSGVDPLVDVVPFEYEAQHAYPVNAVVEPGDAIQTACTWENHGDTTVLPGPLITNEMCEQALIAWPVEAARCE